MLRGNQCQVFSVDLSTHFQTLGRTCWRRTKKLGREKNFFIFPKAKVLQIFAKLYSYNFRKKTKVKEAQNRPKKEDVGTVRLFRDLLSCIRVIIRYPEKKKMLDRRCRTIQAKSGSKRTQGSLVNL